MKTYIIDIGDTIEISVNGEGGSVSTTLPTGRSRIGGYNEGVCSLLLALAVAGLDVSQYRSAIQTAVESGNQD